MGIDRRGWIWDHRGCWHGRKKPRVNYGDVITATGHKGTRAAAQMAGREYAGGWLNSIVNWIQKLARAVLIRGMPCER